MYEANNLSEMARMLIRERRASAEQARLARSARPRRESRKAARASASRSGCRRPEQAAY